MPTRLDEDQTGGCWPNSLQLALLHAALDEDDGALEAWRTWCAGDGMRSTTHDPSAGRLLPLAYLNLARFADVARTTPSITDLCATYEEARAHTLFVFARCAAVLRRFTQAGLDPIVLKGAPLAIAYYRDVGARPMSDMDICVPRERLPAALRILQECGFQPRLSAPHPMTDAFLAVHHACSFSATAAGAPVELDLHWRVLADYDVPAVDAEMRRAARPIEVTGAAVRTLDATDLLFHTCTHGVAWAPLPPVRWIADAVHILRSSASAIDWPRLAWLTERTAATLAVGEALTWLRRHFDLPIPESTVDHITRLPISTARRRFHRANTTRSKLLGRLPFLLARRAALFPHMPLAEYLHVHYSMHDPTADAALLPFLLRKAFARISAPSWGSRGDRG